ncbi:MAG: hypothetical protein PHY44_01875 [Lachnospiraceae bacterium]|nr:hypothetical protein [Lachnospiraceae bacterium]
MKTLGVAQTYSLFEKSKAKTLLNPHIHAGLVGSIMQWQRHAICPQDSFAEQSADQ